MYGKLLKTDNNKKYSELQFHSIQLDEMVEKNKQMQYNQINGK